MYTLCTFKGVYPFERKHLSEVPIEYMFYDIWERLWNFDVYLVRETLEFYAYLPCLLVSWGMIMNVKIYGE